MIGSIPDPFLFLFLFLLAASLAAFTNTMPTQKHRPSFGMLLVFVLLCLTTALQAAVSPVGKSVSRDFFGGMEESVRVETLPSPRRH